MSVRVVLLAVVGLIALNGRSNAQSVDPAGEFRIPLPHGVPDRWTDLRLGSGIRVGSRWAEYSTDRWRVCSLAAAAGLRPAGLEVEYLWTGDRSVSLVIEIVGGRISLVVWSHSGAATGLLLGRGWDVVRFRPTLRIAAAP